MLKTVFVFSFLLLALADLGVAGDPKYPISTIPEELKKEVNAVFREDQMEIVIQEKNSAIIKVYHVITIFNAKAKDHAIKYIGYDKHHKILNMKGAAYDARGLLIKKLKPSDIYDRSAVSGFYEDNRVKISDLSQSNYPYTVEFSYEQEYKTFFNLPSFVLSQENISVENSLLTLVYPKDIAPRYTVSNLEKLEASFDKGLPVKTSLENNRESLSWSYKNIKPIKEEPYGPNPVETMPIIYVAPSSFQYDTYSGTMDSWESLGKFIQTLNRGRNDLPEATRQKAKELTANLKTPEEKAKVLYEFMQGKTRYVSIQMGIGGHQPFPASDVDRTGYGDCKALSNYMVSLLESVGVKSYYTLIKAGGDKPEVDRQFPMSNFNHAVVLLPLENDTLLLECTSQTNPFGYFGSFTNDRNALMITENGGILVRTKDYSADDSKQVRFAQVNLGPNGDGKGKVHTLYTGLQYENGGLYGAINMDNETKKKWVLENTEVPSFELNNFSISQKKDKIPSATVDLDLTLRRLASVSGKRLFLTPNLMNRWTTIPEKNENRKEDIVIHSNWIDVDTIKYSLPENIYPEFMPENIHYKSRFGEYHAFIKMEQGALVYVREMRMNKGRHKPEHYTEFVEFCKNLNKADNLKIVFLNKT